MEFWTRKRFQIRACVISARKAKHLDATTMFTYSHANTPLGQSERAYYLSYFIKCSGIYTIKLLLIVWISLLLWPVCYKPLCIFFLKEWSACNVCINKKFFFEVQWEQLLFIIDHPKKNLDLLSIITSANPYALILWVCNPMMNCKIYIFWISIPLLKQSGQ